jgi:hypothetical protein
MSEYGEIEVSMGLLELLNVEKHLIFLTFVGPDALKGLIAG